MNNFPESRESYNVAKPASKVLLIGLDGASWALFEPLIGAGVLPELGKLMTTGVYGILESTIPPVTASAWSSLYTGRSPGHHGIFDFRRRMGKESTRREWVTHCSIRGPKIWEIASIKGKTVGLINLPLTYPPMQVNGYVISGMPVPPAKDEIGYPHGIISEIIRETGEYISDIDLMRGESPDVSNPSMCASFVNEVEHVLNVRLKSIEYLMSKYPTDFTACVFITPDRLSHLFWKILVPEAGQAPLERWEEELRGRMIDILKNLDSAVGRLTRRMSKDDLIVIISDHGFGPLDHILKLNRLLSELGYLKFRKEVEKSLRKKVGRTLPEFIKKPLRAVFGYGPGMQKGPGGQREFDPYSLIDWQSTRAYSGGSVEQGVFLNVAGREPYGVVQMGGAYHRVRDELIDALRTFKHPIDGKPLFDWVEPREKIYSGEWVELAPDIIYSLRNYRAVVGEDVEPPLIGPWSQPRAGYHRREGIILLKGSMIKEGVSVNAARIQDVAPTILACWGLSLDQGMDGVVLSEAIKPTFLENCPIEIENFQSQVCESVGVGEEDSAEMEDLLKGLGYLN